MIVYDLFSCLLFLRICVSEREVWSVSRHIWLDCMVCMKKESKGLWCLIQKDKYQKTSQQLLSLSWSREVREKQVLILVSVMHEWLSSSLTSAGVIMTINLRQRNQIVYKRKRGKLVLREATKSDGVINYRLKKNMKFQPFCRDLRSGRNHLISCCR